MAQQHTPQTLSIQRRLERWELDHLRALCAVQAEEIERLKCEVDYADSIAEMWQHIHDITQETPQASIGLTQAGGIVAMEGGAA